MSQEVFQVYTKPNCPQCNQAKGLLQAKGLEFKAVEVGKDCTVEELKARVPDAKSVPQIFIGEKYVGGFRELYDHLKG